MSSNKDVKIAPGAVVCVESKLKGNITVGSMTVIHPKASIIAEAGPVLIGENNIIEEQALIIHRSHGVAKENPVPLTIGVNNVFEVGCEIYAKTIGDHNVFEPKCYVGPDVEVGNGCVIGAGCCVTVAEKLPDQTVITGRQCTRSVGLDRPPGPDDLERQQDELTVLSEIFTKEEFSYYSVQAGVITIFEAHIYLPENLVLSLSKDSSKTEFPVCHLPPIRLAVLLSEGYPSRHHPAFTVSSSWLSKHKLDLIVAQLQQLWDENHSEILFIWCSFLKDQSVEVLGLQNNYDLSEKCLVGGEKLNLEHTTHRVDEKVNDHCSSSSTNGASCSNMESNNNKYRYDYRKRRTVPINKKKGEARIFWNSNKNSNDELNFLRSRAIAKTVKESKDKLKIYHRQEINQLYFNLIEYNASKSIEEFNKNMQNCNVCFSPVPGVQCKQLPCSHITCIDCLKRMCEVHIKHGTVEEIVCSQDNCNLEIPVNLIKDLASTELFDKFDKLMLNKTLDSISNIYCPRPHCQYPVSTQAEEVLAVCPSCNHAFCVFCKRAYHGVEGCKMNSEEKRDLIEQYQSGDHKKKLELEKRYGKKQLFELLSNAKTEDWMSKNSKRCPCCGINIEKNDGCNKMICKKCKTNFCWLCLARVSSLNPYLHFQDPKSKCFELLFEGTYNENEENDEFEENLEENEEEDEDEFVIFQL